MFGWGVGGGGVDCSGYIKEYQVVNILPFSISDSMPLRLTHNNKSDMMIKLNDKGSGGAPNVIRL